MKASVNYITAITVLFLLGSCSQRQSTETVVARVGDAVLTKTAVEKMLAEYSLPTSAAPRLVSQWVNDELLYQAALERGLQHDMSVESALQQYRRQLLGQTYLQLTQKTDTYVSQQEVAAVYENNLESFYRPADEALINQFVVSNSDEARRIRNILTDETSGAERKEIFTTHQAEAKIVRRGELIQPLDDAIFNRSSRQNVIGPITTDYGYHVIEVIERNKEGTYRDMDDVYDELRHRLFQNRETLYNIRILDSLRAVTDIEINLENLNR